MLFALQVAIDMLSQLHDTPHIALIASPSDTIYQIYLSCNDIVSINMYVQVTVSNDHWSGKYSHIFISSDQRPHTGGKGAARVHRRMAVVEVEKVPHNVAASSAPTISLATKQLFMEGVWRSQPHGERVVRSERATNCSAPCGGCPTRT